MYAAIADVIHPSSNAWRRKPNLQTNYARTHSLLAPRRRLNSKAGSNCYEQDEMTRFTHERFLLPLAAPQPATKKRALVQVGSGLPTNPSRE